MIDKYLEYYQFHEKDADGNVVCLYCVVTKKGEKINFQIIEDYDVAKEYLREFAYDNELYTVDDLKKNNNLHLQTSNKEFRNLLKKKYNYDTSDVENFHDKVGQLLEADMPIDYEEVLNKKSKKKRKIIEKLKSIKMKKVKKLVVRLGIIASIGFLGFTGIKRGCSKGGTTQDLNVEDYNTDATQVDYEAQDPSMTGEVQDPNLSDEVQNSNVEDDVQNSNVEDDVQDPVDLEVNTLSSFQDYLDQSSKSVKKYMNNFKYNLGAFNGLARNYIDVPKNSRLGLDTSNYTAFQMALLGSDFGSYIDNVSTYWNYDDVYDAYLKTNDQLKQLATVQVQSSGFAKTLNGKERQKFYQKYEDMIIDLNKTTDESEKINKTEKLLSKIKKDFHMDDENYDPEELLRSDSKYIAVMPMVRTIYNKAENNNYENIPSADQMKKLSSAYKQVVSDNILYALSSINVDEFAIPSYEMYTDKIEDILKSVDLYVIDDVRSIKDTDLYKQSQKLPEKEVEVTPVLVEDNTVINETTDSIPVYTTDDTNYEYQDDTTSGNDYTESDTSNDNSEDKSEDNTIAVIEPSVTEEPTEDNENTDDITNDNNNSGDNTSTDDSQIIESEEDTANSMNDAINNGGYAETPDGWQIDDDYKIDGTDVIDGSVSDITIDDSNTDEEVPTVSEDSTTDENNYGIIESEEEYVAPSTDTVEDSTSNEESVITEEVPTYDDSFYSVDTTENDPVYQEEADVTTYQVDEPIAEDTYPVEQTVAALTQEQVIDQIVNYNANGINAIPVFNAADNTWRVEVIDTGAKEAEPMQYNM